MLGNKYIKINGELYPNPVEFSYSLNAIENENTSEAGTDLVVSVRRNKHIFTATWNCTSKYLDKLTAICEARLCTLTWRGIDYTCRARGLNPTLQPYSNTEAITEGLYQATLTFTEV